MRVKFLRAPKNGVQFPQSGIKGRQLALESSTLTMRSPHFPNRGKALFEIVVQSSSKTFSDFLKDAIMGYSRKNPHPLTDGVVF